MTSSSILARSHAFGYSAGAFNLALIFSPLPEFVRVLQTGALEEFPLGITLASFASSALWAQYSILVHDSLYLIPNMIGAIVCAAELLAIYWTVWGAAGSGGGCAQSLLLDVENRPLMPRVRG